MAWDLQRRERIAKGARIAVSAVVVLGLGFAIWRFAGQTAGERREAPSVPVVALTPPPLPPPPQTPPKPKPSEPEKTVETPNPTPKSEAPKSDAPKQLTIAGPPQAGADSGIMAGDGGGRSVGGDPNGSEDGGGGGAFGEAAYRHLLAQALQAAIQSDDEASRLSFTAQVRVWVLPDGRIGKVVIVKSSGDARVDRTVVAALQQAGRLEAPPPQLKFPALVALRGRRA